MWALELSWRSREVSTLWHLGTAIVRVRTVYFKAGNDMQRSPLFGKLCARPTQQRQLHYLKTHFYGPWLTVGTRRREPALGKLFHGFRDLS